VAGAGAAVVLLAACAARTWDQEGVWRDSVSLFGHAVRVSDRNDTAEDFLASAFFAAGRFDEAAAHAARARALNPRNDRVLVTLAGLSERQGRLDEAMALYRSALDLRPDNPLVQCQLGMLEFSRGHAGEARRLMFPVLRADPALRERTLQLAVAALELENLAGARFLDQLVLEAAPDDAGAHAALGSLLIRTGDRAGGLAEWRRAFELDPKLPGLRERLEQAASKP
jgi:Flp pilus assembly protein TadD